MMRYCVRNLNSVYDRLFAHDRFNGQNLFISNPDAELPVAQTLNQMMCGFDNWSTPNGKLWDDSEVSDEEMDRLMEQQKNIPLLWCEEHKQQKPKYNFQFG